MCAVRVSRVQSENLVNHGFIERFLHLWPTPKPDDAGFFFKLCHRVTFMHRARI